MAESAIADLAANNVALVRENFELKAELAAARAQIRTLESQPEPGATALTLARDENERLRAELAALRSTRHPT